MFLRIGAGIAAAVAFGYLAVVGLLLGVTFTTGCLFSSSEPNPLAGIPFLIGTATAVTLGLGALWWAFVDWYWRIALTMLGIAGSIGAVALVVATLVPG